MALFENSSKLQLRVAVKVTLIPTVLHPNNPNPTLFLVEFKNIIPA